MKATLDIFSQTCIEFCELEELLGETYCATSPLIFCQVIPGLCEWCEAAGRDTVLHFEEPRREASMLLKNLRELRGLCLVADTDLRPTKDNLLHLQGSNRRHKKTTVWLVFMGPRPRSAQLWRSRDVDYFQAWHRCQTRVHECIAVTPGDES